jgi:hypothetical protein
MNRIRSVERRNGQRASVLWDVRVIIIIDYLEKGQNINSEYYMALLEHLNDEIKKKRPNALCHKLIKTTAKLHELSNELLPYSLNSPDLASSDLFLFADHKRMLAGKKI